MKARYVERNRLRVVAHNFPAPWAIRSPFISLARYYWHFQEMSSGKKHADAWRVPGLSAWMAAAVVLSAHWSFLRDFSRLLRCRRRIRSGARVSAADFTALLKAHAIPVRQLAAET